MGPPGRTSLLAMAWAPPSACGGSPLSFLIGLIVGVWQYWRGAGRSQGPSWNAHSMHGQEVRVLCVTSLSLSFLIWKMGIMTPSTSDSEVHWDQGCEQTGF